MDLILQCKIFNTSKLEMINACRLYLQVSQLSDIATPDGKRILHKMLHGEYMIEEIHAFRKTTYGQNKINQTNARGRLGIWP
eukprot:scaffold52481_cov61-Attheya_sp.AAC.3